MSLIILLAAACAITWPSVILRAQSSGATPLYAEGGVQPQAVLQGKLGSCYFHSVVAALAQNHPETIRRMIHENEDGSFAVEFADGKKETAYAEDVAFSRESGYDRSAGLWVAVLFRAYAQRVLRESLAAAVDRTDLFALVKHYAEDLIQSNDAVVIAYDRAIRAVVDQEGNIDRVKLEAQLKDQLKPIGVPDDVKDSLIGMLDSGGFFASMETTIKENGEIFGAYRAVGQGGIAERVMAALAGSEQLVENESPSQADAALARATRDRLPIVACTGGSHYYQLLAAHQSIPSGAGGWYVNGHCYTVLGYDASAQSVTLRNPWGEQPNPDGILRLPLASFVHAYLGIVTPTQ